MSTTETRERILTAALNVFSEKGYGASVDDIVRRAGVVKQTLYHHFGSKETLFSEAIKGLADELLITLEPQGGVLRDDLIRFAKSYRVKAFSEQGLAFHRMMVAESARFPELSRAVHLAGSGAARSGLGKALKAAMKRGELRRDDPEFAAEMLLSMLTGLERSGRLHGIGLPADRADDRAEQIVDCFLRAFEPGPPGSVKGSRK